MRKFADYQDPAAYSNGEPVFAVQDMTLSNAVLWLEAKARRNQLVIPLNTSGVLSLDGPERKDLFVVPMPHHSHSIAYEVRLWAKMSSDAAGNEVYTINGQELTPSTTFKKFEFTVPANWFDETLRLSFYCAAGGSNTFTVASVSVFQLEDSSAPEWVDLSGATCKVGVADYPYSSHFLLRAQENAQHVRWRRLQRYNLISHFFRDYKKDGAAFGADEDDLGHYFLAKPAGVDTLYVDLCLDVDTGVQVTVQTDMTDSVEGKIASTGLAPDASGDALWFSHTYTFAGADVADELVVELVIDLKVTKGTGFGYIPGVCVRPEHISASISPVLPATDDFGPGRDILASNLDEVRDSLQQLEERTGLQHCLSDWRWDSVDSDYSGECGPQQAAYDKGDHGPDASTVARAIMWASGTCRRIRVSFGYRISRDAGAGDVAVVFRLSDSMTEATNDDEGPWNGGEWTNPAATAEDLFPYGDAPIRQLVDVLEIAASSDCERPSGVLTRAGTVPHQVWVQALGQAAAYLEPLWVVIQEDFSTFSDLDP